jgi:hypothetical protein
MFESSRCDCASEHDPESSPVTRSLANRSGQRWSRSAEASGQNGTQSGADEALARDRAEG